MESSSNKTVTIRRRLASLTAILNYAYAELRLDERNPFSRMIINGEGNNSLKRGVITNDQLKLGYDTALTLRTHNQNRTVAARAIADVKTFGHLS